MKAVVLTRGRIATVDDEDFDRVNQFKWTASEHRKKFYAVRSVKRGGMWTQEYLHHFVFGESVRLDHRNGDTLDTRKENLRPASILQNNRAFREKAVGTTSQFRGVTWDSVNKKWRAKIRVNERTQHLGRFSAESDAAAAYNDSARENFGEFAGLNAI